METTKDVSIKKRRGEIFYKILEEKKNIISQIRAGKSVSEIERENGVKFVRPL